MKIKKRYNYYALNAGKKLIIKDNTINNASASSLYYKLAIYTAI